MSKPDIYARMDEMFQDIVILQIALALLSEKLAPIGVKMDADFWSSVHQIYNERFSPAEEPEPAAEGGEA